MQAMIDIDKIIADKLEEAYRRLALQRAQEMAVRAAAANTDGLAVMKAYSVAAMAAIVCACVLTLSLFTLLRTVFGADFGKILLVS